MNTRSHMWTNELSFRTTGRTVVLSAAFFLLMLVGAAASAFVFADRFAQLVKP